MKKLITILSFASCLALGGLTHQASSEEVSSESTCKRTLENWPTPTDEQMAAFQKGDILAVSAYVGDCNDVVLAFNYLTEGVDVNKEAKTGVIVRHYRVISSTNPRLKTGAEFTVYQPVEDGAKTHTSAYRKDGVPDEDVFYLFNLKETEFSIYNGNPIPTWGYDRYVQLKSSKKSDYDTLKATLKMSD